MKHFFLKLCFSAGATAAHFVATLEEFMLRSSVGPFVAVLNLIHFEQSILQAIKLL